MRKQKDAAASGDSVEVKRSFAADLADINAATLHLLRHTPELFDAAAESALRVIMRDILAVRGKAILKRLLDGARP